MQSHSAGKRIEQLNSDGSWVSCEDPRWNWSDYSYRLEPNKYTEAIGATGDLGVKSTRITFGILEHIGSGDKKIVYDSHIRNALIEQIPYGGIAAFRLVATNQFGEDCIDAINTSKYAK